MTVPEGEALDERLDDVLTVVWVMFNEAYLSTSGTQDRDLAADAVWLADVIATSLPRHAEAWGLAVPAAASSTPAATRASPTTAPWCCSRTRTAPAGTAPRSTAPTRCWSAPPPCAGRAASSSRRPSPPATRTRPSWDGDRLAADRDALRPAPGPRPVTGGPAQPRDRGVLPRPAPGRRRPRRGRGDGGAGSDGYAHFHSARAALLRAVGRPEEAREADARASRSPATRPSSASSGHASRT